MSGLGDFHHEEAPDKVHKWVAWAAIVLIVGGLAVYVVEAGFFSPQTSTTQNYPRGL